ncbi:MULTISPECIES: IclR family transcriptional regulator [unclassified Micromonospora]|uniref:IclR family transcriptional regulator n=1 Tax=Micromonospora sp. NPDC049903 TaxID=3364276 RepID=UPI00379846A6
MTSDNGSNQSILRAVAILDAFLLGRPELRVTDVARQAGLGVSTASRLLSTLESLGLVERDPISNLYRLGPKTVTLGGVALNQSPVYRAARQTAQNLAAEHGLGVNLAIRRDDHGFYLGNFEGRSAPRAFSLIGQSIPLHATGLGKALLLGVDPAQRRVLLGDTLVGFTHRTITDHDRLDAELATSGARGYSTEEEELALGRACLAAPIRNASGEIVAALSISGPLSAINLAAREAALATAVIEAADAVSVALGHHGPARVIVSQR